MARMPSNFRQSDLARAIRALVASGVDIASIRVEITRAGAIVTNSGATASQGDPVNQWDQATEELRQ